MVEPEIFCRGVEKLILETAAQREGFSMRGIEHGQLFASLLTLACAHSVQLESNFVATCCSLMVLEGVGKALDPERDLVAAARPYLLSAVRKASLYFQVYFEKISSG